ncbi:efflux RND transporter periplasmic adaptor subunit [Flavobacterium sp. MC2016-06]|jgi:membrane fusion protein (multidrug efflux system)|uniref:efflux RND transporter periplasmic adaptor subunit n=1 Tax=Flavobacterium sp. MC2016-06 TaxID=2676308 RepID=UPI0012BAD6F7|nr:efflux RND transporter periplasmic adaptor subunit [Flavobacterium sp. MC2016-06]MBU3860642.1 efflux RND transporter periplasmic adaptor subunit [Flavobacterium sp. MC2016-06]
MSDHNKKHLRSLLFLTVLISLFGCGKSEKEAVKKQEIPSVDALLLKQGSLSDTLTIPGELLAYQQVDLFAKVNSFVKKLYADVGTHVNKGQLLALMEAPEMGSQNEGALSRIKAREATYQASRATYSRLLETSKTPGTISQNNLDIAKAQQSSDYAQLQAAKAALREIENTQNYLEIRAPFSGVITKRNISVGAYAGAGGTNMPLFTLQEQKKLRMVLNIPESNTGTLKVGQQVGFTVKSLPGYEFKATASRFSGALDDRLRAQHIEMDVDNQEKKLLPGMIPEIKVALGSTGEKNFIIPQSALLRSTQGTYVIKVISGKTIWVQVATGAETLEKITVYGKISVNDTLIKIATEEVRNGEKITGNIKIIKE